MGYIGIGYVVLGLIFVEMVVIEVVVGVLIWGGIVVMGIMVINWYSGKFYWMDILKIELLVFGGVLRIGFVFGFLFGYFMVLVNKKLCEEFE